MCGVFCLQATLLNGALECLKNASQSEQKISDQVLMLYAFTLAKLPDYREPLLQKLMKKAKTEGSIILNIVGLPKFHVKHKDLIE